MVRLGLLLLRLVLLLHLAPTALASCRLVTVESSALEFVNGEYELAGWQRDGNEEESFSHNGRAVYASVEEPRRYLFHLQVCAFCFFGFVRSFDQSNLSINLSINQSIIH